MQIGLYFDARNPPRWRRPWTDHYARIVELVVEGERLGLHSAWFGEHHLFEDGYLPQPLVLAAAAAARTSRIRLGTSVLLAPLRPAIDIAEQAALVDVISDGRMELGIGAGYRVPEYAAYGVDVDRRFALLRARTAEVRALWERGEVTPPPVQRRPPIWLGARGPRLVREAGRLGEGLLTLDEEAYRHYRAALVEAGHPPERARVGGTVNLVLADDPEAAWARIRPHLAYQWETYRRYGQEGRSGGDAPQALSDEAAAQSVDALRSPGPVMNPPFFDVVTVEDAEARLRAWLGDMPVVHGAFWASIAGMPDDLVERHVELLAGELAPAVADLGVAASPREVEAQP